MKKSIPISLLVLLVVTLACGTAGYLQAGALPDGAAATPYGAFLQAFFLLVLNGPIEPSNALIEIARWTGIVFALEAVASVIAGVLFRAAFEDLRLARALRGGNAVAIHGSGVYADALAANLGERAIRSERPRAFRAKTQVVMFPTDGETLAFYEQNKAQLVQDEHEVHLCLNGIDADASREGANVFTFNLAELCAELYWKKHPVNEPQRIALVGEGRFAEELLTHGLIVNIFSVQNGVDYEVFGDFAAYRALHERLSEAMDENADTLVFSEVPWQASLSRLRGFDRVIVCFDDGRGVQAASALRAAGVNRELHVRCDQEDAVALLWPNEHVTGVNAEGKAIVAEYPTVAFGTAAQLCTEEYVLKEALHREGRLIDIGYWVLEGNGQNKDCGSCAHRACACLEDWNACLACSKHAKRWRKMDKFTKWSNYMAAAHDDHKRLLLEQHDALKPGGFDALPATVQDELQEIEHIRWNRYHRLNNWEYARVRDDSNRLHPYLLPYRVLETKVQRNDADAYRKLCARAGDCNNGETAVK